jgi:hypothetical protein
MRHSLAWLLLLYAMCSRAAAPILGIFPTHVLLYSQSVKCNLTYILLITNYTELDGMSFCCVDSRGPH